MADVMIIGSYNTGFTIYTDCLPAPGETLIGHRLEQGPGGKGANQAIGAMRLGADVCLVTKVGHDSHGAEARSILLNEGLPERGILTGSGATGMAFITVESTGENSIVIAPGTNLELSSGEVISLLSDDFEDCNWVLLQLECSSELAVDLARWARRRGKHAVLNPAPARAFPTEDLALFEVITPNELELSTLSAPHGLATAPVDVQAKACVDRGVANVVVTLGKAGAMWACAAGVRSFDSYPVEAVDTTGAGDAFNAAFVAARARGEAMEVAVDQGCRAGAYCVTRRGVIDGLPTRDELGGIL